MRWDRLALLAGAAIMHLHLSCRVERQRRDHSHTPHVDLVTIWTGASALTLAPVVAVVLVLVVYGHRWWLVGRWDASRPPHRALFTLAMMVLTVLAAHTVATWLDMPALIADQAHSWRLLLGLVLVGATQWTVNSSLVGGVIALTTTGSRWRTVLGGAQDNLVEVAQLATASVTALLLVTWPALVPLVVVLAVAVHNLVLLNQWRLAARTDARTGLLTAETWHQQVESELTRSRQQGIPVALLMIDVDHFKQVNDAHGHAVGDDVLSVLGELLSREVRHGDVVGRLGGEEFGVLLPSAASSAAVGVAERIRAQVHTIRVPLGGGEYLTGVTVSLGVASFPEIREPTVQGLLAAADAALYTAKRAGRDQVMTAGHQRANPLLPAVRTGAYHPAGHDDGPPRTSTRAKGANS